MFYTYYIKAENKYYFGSRTRRIMLKRAAKDDFMIKYFSSTTDKRLQEIIRKGEYEKAEIIKEYTDRQECLKDEERLIKIFWAFYGRENCWNHKANDKWSTAGIKFSEEIIKKRGESIKEAYNNMSDEKKEEKNKNISEAWNNKTDEKKEEIIKKIRETFDNKTDEEKEEIYKKISERTSEAWNNKTDEEKQARNEKIRETFDNKTDEEKEEIYKKISEAHKGKPLSNKHKEKISKGSKGKPKPMTDEHKENISKTLKGKPQPKFYWQTPEGEIKIMAKGNAVYLHPDWIFIGPVES